MQRNNEHPNFIVCILTSEIYKEPVIVSPSAHTYEREALEKHINNRKSQGRKVECPKSRIEITSYIKNFDMISGVELYLTMYPAAKNDQYKPDKPDEHYCSNPVFLNQLPEVPLAASNQAPSSEISADDRVAIEAAQAELDALPIPRESHVVEEEQRRALMERLMHESERERARERERRRLQTEEQHRLRMAELERVRRENQERERLRVEREREVIRERERERERQIEENNKIVPLYGNENTAREMLLQDIQNLIWALRFEEGPVPRGTIDRWDGFFFAVIEKMLTSPNEWQKIKVSAGPTLPAMYIVLVAAKQALKRLDIEILNKAKSDNKGNYDCVQKKLGTITNQPGDLVHKILTRVEAMINILRHKNARHLRK